MKKGQALIVVLLILGVVATIGLSVISRSVTEVKQSTVQEESARALEAAEVGLEKYLGGVAPAPGVVTNVDTGGSAKFSLGTPQSIGLTWGYRVPFLLEDGDTATLDFANSSGGFTGNGVRICWGEGVVAGEEPAVIVSLYYQEFASYEVRMISKAYDPRAAPRATGWVQVPAGNSSCGTGMTFAYNYHISFTSVGAGLGPAAGRLDMGPGTGPLFLRVKMMYNRTRAHPVAFTTWGPTGELTVNFPLQAGSVESVGVSGDSVQRMKAVVPNYDMPGVFDSAIFSGTSLVK